MRAYIAISEHESAITRHYYKYQTISEMSIDLLPIATLGPIPAVPEPRVVELRSWLWTNCHRVIQSPQTWPEVWWNPE
jgi:hypothetical protein